MRKLVSLLLAAMMLLGVLPACAEETLEPVTLEWYVAENTLPDNATVFEALNKYFKEKINTTVNFHFIPISEYAQKVSPMLDTNQAIDIVNRSEEHTSELQSQDGISYAVFCLKKIFFFNDTATTEIYTLSLHDALPILCPR